MDSLPSVGPLHLNYHFGLPARLLTPLNTRMNVGTCDGRSWRPSSRHERRYDCSWICEGHLVRTDKSMCHG